MVKLCSLLVYATCVVLLAATFARRMWASLALSAAAAMQIAVACRGNRDSSVKTLEAMRAPNCGASCWPRALIALHMYNTRITHFCFSRSDEWKIRWFVNEVEGGEKVPNHAAAPTSLLFLSACEERQKVHFDCVGFRATDFSDENRCAWKYIQRILKPLSPKVLDVWIFSWWI